MKLLRSTFAFALAALFSLSSMPAAHSAQLMPSVTMPSGTLAAKWESPTNALGLNQPIGHLSVQHFHKHKLVASIDEGYGLVTNVGVAEGAALMSGTETSLTGGIGAFNTHGTGTSATAAAATDYQLGTAISSPGGATGVQTNVSVAGTAKYQTVATEAYTSTLAVTEWGLFTASTAFPSVTTGTPFTATSATGGTATGTPYTAHLLQGSVIVAGATLAIGVIADNTTSAITIGPQGWLLASNDATAGSTPGSTVAFTIFPAMWDHKVFSAINVVSGDSIQFTYTCTWTSGG